MGIQVTGSFVYNDASYNAPYFRLTPTLAGTGNIIPVETTMYKDYKTFVTSSIPTMGGAGPLTNIGLYVTGSAPVDATGANVTDKYLYWVTSEVISQLQRISPGTTFTITNIPS